MQGKRVAMNYLVKQFSHLWNLWGVRLLILLSLCLQIILTFFGNRRKSTARRMTRISIWAAYLTAEWAATSVLDNLATSQEEYSSDGSIKQKSVVLQKLWAPFLLIHLGGPDTITSFSLEDNELWLKHFFELIIELKVIFYVFAQYWSSNAFTFITIPIVVSGIIKYIERTWALRSSSTKYFKNSLPSEPDRCEDLTKYNIERGENGLEEEKVVLQDYIHEHQDLVEAFYLFERFKFFFVGRSLGKEERIRVYSIIKDKEATEAFKLVEIELGFMYDLLYTKANTVYSRWGIFLRCITLFCSVSALIFFSMIININVYSPVDLSITFLLLIMAVLLEIFQITTFFSSDWAKLSSIKLIKARHNPFSKPLVDLWRFIVLSHSPFSYSKRWSKSIGQYNLISSCLKNVQSICIEVRKLPCWGELWEKKIHLTREDEVVEDLQEMIFMYVKEQSDRINRSSDQYIHRNSILDQRGNFALEARSDFRQTILWSTIEIDFIDSLVIWHIATDLLYYANIENHDGQKIKTGKYLSEYMLYLLVCRSSMLPKDVSEIRYKQACDEVTKILEQQRNKNLDHKLHPSRARIDLYHEYLEKLEGDGFNGMIMVENQSLLKYGCLLARQLQMLMEIHGEEVTWEVISKIWVEMLAYAAHNCEWKEHPRHLSKGGELLAHVQLLLAHFGLSKQFIDNEYIPFLSQYFCGEEISIQIEG